MLIADYDTFVRQSDQYAGFSKSRRREIAIYGVVSEIGSLVSAVKKERLQEAGAGSLRGAKREVAEEIGDIIWYCFSLAQIENDNKPADILATDIRALAQELTGDDDSVEMFRAALSTENLSAFLKGAEDFPKLRDRSFDDYQELAYKTARTGEDVLLGVCLSVLWQLGAELMRVFLPKSEKRINRRLPDRPVNRVLGEIAWHLAATATVYELSLDQIVRENIDKVQFRTNRENPTPLHDEGAPDHERLPRKFEVKFLTIEPGRSRMYFQGGQLGDDLTDNAYEPDGYRFHDVMHLANAAKLGWSPVLRALFGRKRKYDLKIDEVEDGARARIVEEAVIKTIHSEGKKQSAALGLDEDTAPLFSNRADISFSFLKFVRGLIAGLEVEKNKFWEWEDAIYDGYTIYNQLRLHQQGTVSVDLEARTIIFSEHVVVDLKGVVAGIGTRAIDLDAGPTLDGRHFDDLLTASEIKHRTHETTLSETASIIAAKCAILESLGLDSANPDLLRQLALTVMPAGKLSIKAKDDVQDAIWANKVITFKTSLSHTQNSLSCSALAISDPAKAG